MLKPKPIKPGDKIGILSPAGKIEKSYVNETAKFIKALGYSPVIDTNAFNEYHQFAGTDDERAESFQKMLDDDSIKAILCSRGGYGSIRIIDKLNFDKFKTNPKWIIGYSDITVFHSYLNRKLNCASIHGIMPKNFDNAASSKDSFKRLFSVLDGQSLSYTIASHNLNIVGKTTGTLIGGNLSILLNLRGTDIDIIPEDSILFIEDIGEYLYNIDRVLNNLKYSGILKKLKGVIVGYFTNIQDNPTPFGKSAYEIIYDSVKSLGIPVCFGFPAGHELPNYPLILGNTIELEVFHNKKSKISFIS